ncbi:MAG: hypothetical protein AAF997_18835, partial [Myxococcota bacterium]
MFAGDIAVGTAQFVDPLGSRKWAGPVAGGILVDATMADPWTILCEGPELAVDVARGASRIGLEASPRVAERGPEEAIEGLEAGQPTALALEQPPSPDLAVRLGEAARLAGASLPVSVVGPMRLGLLHDLGLPATHEVGPMLAVAALVRSGADQPWAATTKDLPSVDRLRLGDSVSPRASGRFVRADDGLIAHVNDEGDSRVLGTPRDVAAALRAMRSSHGSSRPKVPVVEGVEADVVLDTILGPRRALSDPASKAA